MKVVADANIPYLEETFGQHAEVVTLPGRSIRSKDLRSADALVVRSVTQVNEQLVGGSPVQFVGTATIGTDHLDKAWLGASRIAWHDAPGCNADAAAQWSLAMLLLACHRQGLRLPELTVGIVGHGNVGRRLHRLLNALSIDCRVSDPPLAELGETNLVDLEEILSCPVVSIHVPLTRAGRHATFHLLDGPRLERLSDGTLLLNSARGDVVAEEALLAELGSGRLIAALDTWPHEPCIHDRLLDLATVATPHVAGYSEEGKRNGLGTIYQAFCAHFGFEPHNVDALPQLALPDGEALAESSWQRVVGTVLQVCPVERDDEAFRVASAMNEDRRSAHFDDLRRQYQPRREFSAWRVSADHPERNTLGALGFQL